MQHEESRRVGMAFRLKGSLELGAAVHPSASSGQALDGPHRDWLPQGDLDWFILDAVEQLDLGEFYAAYRSDGWGAAAYDPWMMVAVLLYAYSQRMRSSREIARALERDAGSRVVAADAALSANRTYDTIDEEARRMLAEARAVDEEEDTRYGPDRCGDELPAGLGRRAGGGDRSGTTRIA